MANKALNQVSQVQSTELANVKTFLAVMNNGEIKQMSKEDMSAVVGELNGKYKSYGIKYNVNADDLKETGVYYLSTGCTPEYAFLEVLKIADKYIWQRYIRDGGGTTKSRVLYDNEWKDWS